MVMVETFKIAVIRGQLLTLSSLYSHDDEARSLGMLDECVCRVVGRVAAQLFVLRDWR